MLIKEMLKNTSFGYALKLFKLRINGNKSINQKKKEISKRYLNVMGRELDWNNPKSYTEKLNYSKLLCSNALKTRLSDKVLVRSWVEEKIGAEYLVPLLGVYDKFSDIDFSVLPDKFVIKCNHDSGSVTICEDKNTLNLKELEKKYNYLLKRRFSDTQYEMQYESICPKIMIEKHMGANINDYKFLCFNGEPVYCWVDTDRYYNHKRNIYDMEWNLQPFNQYEYGNTSVKVEKPEHFEKMSSIVKCLSKGFDHVRVDLYVIDNMIYFGEMTFTNGSGFEKITPVEWDYKLGDLWKLDVRL